MAQWVKNLPAMQETQETQFQSLNQENPLEEEDTDELLDSFEKELSLVAGSTIFVHCVCAKSLQLCLTLCDSMDCNGSLPSFSVHGIFQARVLEWVAISFSRGSSRPRD